MMRGAFIAGGGRVVVKDLSIPGYEWWNDVVIFVAGIGSGRIGWDGRNPSVYWVCRGRIKRMFGRVVGW